MKGFRLAFPSDGIPSELKRTAVGFCERPVPAMEQNRSYNINPSPMPSSRGIQMVALFEASKGAIVLLAGVGLFGWWHQRAWAEWFAAGSSGLYLPIEVWELSRGITGTRVTVSLVNAGILAYLVGVLIRRQRGRGVLSSSGPAQIPPQPRL